MLQTRAKNNPDCFLTPYRLRKNSAQATLEYAGVIVCLVAALLAMQVYVKRALQGRLRQEGDAVGQQYGPKNTIGSSSLIANSTTVTTSNTASEADLGEDLDGDGIIKDDVFTTDTTTELRQSRSTESGNETVGALESSLF